MDSRLPRAQRIRKRAAFLAVQSRGRKLHTESFLVFVLPSQGASQGASQGVSTGSAAPVGPRLGVTVSKKVGGAVTRNRVKRRVREAFRHLKALFPKDLDLVFIAKQSAGKVEQAQVSRELERLCARHFAT